MPNRVKTGLKLAFATAMISGVSNFVNKLAVTGIQPLVLTSVKNSIVFLLIAGISILFIKKDSLKQLSKKDWIKLVSIGVIGGSLPFYLFFTALTQMPAINAALIHKSLIFWVALLAVPLLKERITPHHLTGLILLFGSNFLIGGFKGFTFSRPELMVLAATILWSLENVIAKVTLKRIDPLIVAGARMGFGSLILLGATAFTGKMQIVSSLSLQQWGMIALTAIFLLGYVTSWYSALKYAPAISVASILVSATVVTNILSAIFVTRAFSVDQFYQAVLVLAGIAFVVMSSRNLGKDPARQPTTI